MATKFPAEKNKNIHFVHLHSGRLSIGFESIYHSVDLRLCVPFN